MKCKQTVYHQNKVEKLEFKPIAVIFFLWITFFKRSLGSFGSNSCYIHFDLLQCILNGLFLLYVASNSGKRYRDCKLPVELSSTFVYDQKLSPSGSSARNSLLSQQGGGTNENDAHVCEPICVNVFCRAKHNKQEKTTHALIEGRSEKFHSCKFIHGQHFCDTFILRCDVIRFTCRDVNKFLISRFITGVTHSIAVRGRIGLLPQKIFWKRGPRKCVFLLSDPWKRNYIRIKNWTKTVIINHHFSY